MGWIFIFAAAFGLIIGSFLNVVVHRGPVMWGLIARDQHRFGGLALPRSYCPHCGQTLGVSDLIPLASFVFRGGKCRYCKAPISVRYPIIELAGAGAAVAAVALWGPSLSALLAAVFLWALIALAAIDAETGYLPDAITLPLILIGIIANIGDRFAPLQDALIGAAAGYLSFRLIGMIFKRLRGVDGLGQGDAKLLAALGAWGGWALLPVTVFLAALLALVGVIFAVVLGKSVDRDTEVPFGPALVVAGGLAFMLTGAGVDVAAIFAPPIDL